MIDYIYTRECKNGEFKQTTIAYCHECKKVVDRTYMWCPFCGDPLYNEDARKEEDDGTGCKSKAGSVPDRD